MNFSTRSLLDTLGLLHEFPTGFFPTSIEQYRQDQIRENRIPGDFVAAGICAAFSAATGNSVAGRHGTKQFVSANLFLLMIGNPGSRKTPALIQTLEPVRREQASRERAARVFQLTTPTRVAAAVTAGEMSEHCEGNDDAPAVPQPVRHLLLTDATIPAIQYALWNNPRGLLMEADEVLSLFKASGKGGDRSAWLQIWNADNLTIARRTGKPPVVTIPRSFVSIVAGVQPGLFPRLRNPNGDDGLLDRFLLLGDGRDGWPEYSHGNIDPGLAAEYNAAVERVIHHRDHGVANELPPPAVLDIDDTSSGCFKSLHDRLIDSMVAVQADQRYGGLITKLVANAQRLALLRAVMRWAVGENGDGDSPERLSVDDAAAACSAAEFFFGRALLWRPELTASGSVAPEGVATATAVNSGDRVSPPRDLAEVIVAYMGRSGQDHVTIRKLQASGVGKPAKAAALRTACQHLVDTGRGRWGNNPAQDFLLTASNKQTANRARRHQAAAALA